MADERLESWKEIAAYLRRDVRTVQRWEQTDGLPIHRHQRAHRPIPYAYKAELDAWWTSRSEPPADVDAATVAAPKRPRYSVVAALALLTVAIAAAAAYRTIVSRSHEPAIAVLPFLDLSEGMKNEEFADGITEELIDRLNKVRGLRVPAPTASFYFKNKHVPIADIARTLRVTHVLDGSVRKSGPKVRVAVRLVRADTGDVVWSETYDRQWDDLLVVQDDIAGKVTKALTESGAIG
jgi:transcriptional activator of cad operon